MAIVLSAQNRADADMTTFCHVDDRSRVDGLIRVPAQTVVVLNVQQGTAVPGCAVAVASTGIDVTTTTTPPRLVAKRVSVPDERRDNHHDVEIRGRHSFLDHQDSNLFLAILLNDPDGAAPAAPDLPLHRPATLWIAMAIPKTGARAKARASPRAKKRPIRAPRAEPQTEKKANHHATNIATASVRMESNADSGTLRTARTCLKQGTAGMARIAPTSMQVLASRAEPMP
jgi:hypothetical protein